MIDRATVTQLEQLYRSLEAMEMARGEKPLFPSSQADLREALAFDDWWLADGQYIDPDTSDVPWFDKRRGLAEAAFKAGRTK